MKTIMIIDDNPTIQRLSRTIEDEPITIKTVENTRKALEELHHDENITLLLLNTTIPDEGKNGYLAIDPHKKTQIDSTDASNYLPKPFNNDQFHRFLKQSFQHNE